MVKGDTINVCRGTAITYESTAEGSPIIQWQFNNGTPATMTGAGPFNVTYNTNGYDTTFQKVGTGAFADSMFIIVRVFDLKPDVGFNFSPDNVCGNETIQFTNTSTQGEPLSYLWSFDDGSTSLDQDPTHQFLSAVGSAGTQTFQVKLVVTNSNFCVDSITRNVTIRSVPDATIGNADPFVTVSTHNDIPSFRVCDGQTDHNFKFSNESTTTAINASYTISWGDGTADTTFTSWPAGTIVNHTFPAGISMMTVSVTGSSGCVGIKQYVVYVGSFPYGQLNTTASLEICETDSISFNITDTHINSPGTTYFFYVNDGTESQYFQHPPPPIAGHRFNKNSCDVLSDDGNQVFSNAYGAYLLVQNPCGVASDNIVPIHVSGRPKAVINVSAPVVCENNAVTLINTSSFGNVITPGAGANSLCENKGKNVWSISPATGFTITGGSMGSLNGNVNNQALWTDATDTLDLQFITPGIYTVKIYVGNERCGIDSTTTTICVRAAPQASFNMSNRYSCGPSVVDFTNTTAFNSCDTIAKDVYQWTVSYTDPQGCAVAGDPTYAFENGTSDTSRSPSISFTAVGRYVIQLLVRSTNIGSGCADAIFTDSFFVKGPLTAQLSSLPDACINNAVQPTVQLTSCYSTGPFGYQWSFSNGTPSSSTDSLPGMILFATPGTHDIKLIVIDSSCLIPVTVTGTINVLPLPDTRVANDTIVCSGSPVALGGDAVAGVTYQWTPVTGLDDPSAANPTATLIYAGPANDTTYTYYSTISQGQFCIHTDSVKITVNRVPVVVVAPASAQICAGSSIELAASGADSYTWNADPTLNTTTGSTVIASPVVTSTYTVNGTLSNGCSSGQSVTVSVFESPVAGFELNPSRVCVGQPITVTNNSSNATGYTWTWGDGNSSAFASGQHVYATAGSYDVTLITRRLDASGFVCYDTLSKPVAVISKITAQLNVGPERKCVPYVLNVNAANATGAELIEWTMYDSSAAPGEFHATGASASHVYQKAGSYSARLVVHTATGCTDTAYYDFKVAGTPVTVFDPALVNVCGVDTTVTFVAQTISDGDNAINYRWFVNGQQQATSNPFTFRFQGTPGSTTAQEFTIRLEAENASGCGETSLTGKVILHPVPDPDIQVSPALVQQQPNYEFTFKDLAPSNVNVTHTWSMGDRTMQTRDGQQVTYQYSDTGTYHVKLSVKDFASGCSAVDSVTVSILHVPGYIQVPNAICPGCSNASVRKFLPLAKGLKTYRLTVYTTLGQKVFETTSLDADGSPNVPWDGTLNGRTLQQDVYSWQIEATFRNGSEWKGMIYPGKNKPVKAGFITVVK